MYGRLMTLCLLATAVGAGDSRAEPSAQAVYGQYCSVCHGDRGDGRSRARGSMVPPPIELSRERMLLAVAEGRPGTAMAAWKNQLNSQQIEAVVDYIRATMMLPAVTADSEEGRRLYAENCSVCHGDDGRGARWTLTNLKPPPRNFTLPGSAQQLATDYMRQVVSHGKADTAMPGFASQLDAHQIAAVVSYVRTAFMAATPSVAETTTPAGPDMAAQIPGGLVGDPGIGQAFYLQNCVACHGLEGDGKGPRAYFILPKPRNFRHPAARHGLNRPKLYQAIARGTRGTDMPAWEKVLSAQEIAHLTEYLFQAFIRPQPPADQSSVSDRG